MNEVTLPKIARDLSDELDGLRWACSGDTAYQIYTGDTADSDTFQAVMHLKDYGEAALRTASETDTHIDDDGLKVFELELERHGTPVSFRTSSLDDELDLFDRIQQQEYHGTAVPVVPPEYLLASILTGEGDKSERLNAVRDATDIEKDFLRECMRVLGVEPQLQGDID